tara:strand:- start:60 stop:509 length:450 start_codon:yes stop_codon:yes gene_type:complete
MSKTVENIFVVDNKMGYRFGWMMWLVFFVPSVGVLFSDTTAGVDRDFLLQCNLFSCISLLCFNYYFWRGIPASTPGMFVIFPETMARLLLISYYGIDNITTDSGIGKWNWFQVVASFMFAFFKFIQTVWVLFNRRTYMAYEEEQKEKMY